MRRKLPFRIITDDPDRYSGLAAMLGGWGSPAQLVTPAMLAATPAIETTVDLVALDGDVARTTVRHLLHARQVTGSAIISVIRRGRPRPASLALALGCDDTLAFPMEEDELQLRLDASSTLGLLSREACLRSRLLERHSERRKGLAERDPAGIDPIVVLVGPPSPAQVKVAEALPLKTVAFMHNLSSAKQRLREERPPLLTIVTAHDGFGAPDAAIQELNAVAAGRGSLVLLAAPSRAFTTTRALELGFADRLATDDTPEELHCRLHFWLKTARLKAGLAAQRLPAISGTAADPTTGLFSRSFLLDYLSSRDAFPAGRPRAFLVVRITDLVEIEGDYGHKTGETILREFGRRILASTRHEDLQTHLGHGAFCIVLATGPDVAAAPLARRLTHVLEQPVELSGGPQMPTRLGSSIGLLARPADAARTLDVAIQQATSLLRVAA